MLSALAVAIVCWLPGVRGREAAAAGTVALAAASCGALYVYWEGREGFEEDNLECRREGSKCVLVEKETEASREADVKCPYALRLMGLPRGAATMSGYHVTDSGRLRGREGDSERRCALLLTDPLVMNRRGVTNCSPTNSRLTKVEFNKKFVSGISKNAEDHTCEVRFSEGTTADDMKAFLSNLDERAMAAGQDQKI